MKKTTRAGKPRQSHIYTETQLAGLKQSNALRRQATVERLHTAIESLKSKKQEISVQTIFEECGLRYAAIHRNPEALALFRASSSHLVVQKKRNKRKRAANQEEIPSARDPLLNYKKPQLVERLRATQQQSQELQRQVTVLAEEACRREARIAELEAALASLEPYRTFVEHIRSRLHQEEEGRFGNLPPGG